MQVSLPLGAPNMYRWTPSLNLLIRIDQDQYSLIRKDREFIFCSRGSNEVNYSSTKWKVGKYHYNKNKHYIVLTTTIASLSTLTAAWRGVSPRSSRHLTSAPDFNSRSTMLKCFPRMALCNGVLPTESGAFMSRGNKCKDASYSYLNQ